MAYYSALKRKEIPAHATPQMNLEDILPSKSSQPQKGKDFLVPVVVKLIQTKSRMGVPRCWENGELLFKGYRVLVLEDEEFCSDGCTAG